MVRVTSKAAFLKLREGRKIGPLQNRILDYVWSHPGCTRRSISKNTGIEINVVTPRVRELLDSGMLIEQGSKIDPGNNRHANCLFLSTEKKVG